MTLRHIEIFHALCQHEYNTTKAAQALNMTQPAVSLAVKELESHYGVPLFDRIGRKLVITEAGKRFEEYAKSIGAVFYDMDKEMKNWDKHGIIRIGATTTIAEKILPDYVKKFQQENENVQIKVFCGPADIIEQKLLSNQLDFAFSEGIAKDPSIVSHPYIEDRLVPFCSAEGPYTYNQTVSIEQFRSNNFVLRASGSGTRDIFDHACKQAGFAVEPVWESVSNSGVIAAAARGIGVGVLSCQRIDWLSEQRVVVPFNVEGFDLSRMLYVVYHKNKKLSSLAKQFLYMCKENDVDTSLNFVL